MGANGSFPQMPHTIPIHTPVNVSKEFIPISTSVINLAPPGPTFDLPHDEEGQRIVQSIALHWMRSSPFYSDDTTDTSTILPLISKYYGIDPSNKEQQHKPEFVLVF